MKRRNSYFDALRGIAILMVVAIHTFMACDFDCFINYMTIGIRQLLNMAVPLFLAISGFFIGRKNFDNINQMLVFWKKQICKVYIPVLFWSLFYLGEDLYNGKHIVRSLVEYFICGYSVYYFIALIIQCYLVLPLIQRYLMHRLWGG